MNSKYIKHFSIPQQMLKFYSSVTDHIPPLGEEQTYDNSNSKYVGYNRGFSGSGFDKQYEDQYKNKSEMINSLINQLAVYFQPDAMYKPDKMFLTDANDLTDYEKIDAENPDWSDSIEDPYDANIEGISPYRDSAFEQQARSLKLKEELDIAPDTDIEDLISNSEITKDTMRALRDLGYSPLGIQNIINKTKTDLDSIWTPDTVKLNPIQLEKIQRIVWNLVKQYGQTVSDARLKNVIKRRFD
jgi:hypothetical protein